MLRHYRQGRAIQQDVDTGKQRFTADSGITWAKAWRAAEHKAMQEENRCLARDLSDFSANLAYSIDV